MNCCLQSRKKATIRPSPFCSFFVECVFWFWVGRTEKKKKQKIGKGGRYLSISVEPGNNEVWLQSQHGGNRRCQNQTRTGKTCFYVWDLIDNCLKKCIIAFCVTFFENEKIWISRTTLNREKRNGLIIIFLKKLVSVIFVLQQFNAVYLFVYDALRLFIRISLRSFS